MSNLLWWNGSSRPSPSIIDMPWNQGLSKEASHYGRPEGVEGRSLPPVAQWANLPFLARLYLGCPISFLDVALTCFVSTKPQNYVIKENTTTPSVTAMKWSFSSPLLEHRRKLFWLSPTKCITKIPFRCLSLPSYISTRIDQQCKVNVLFCHTKHFHKLFSIQHLSQSEPPSSFCGCDDRRECFSICCKQPIVVNVTVSVVTSCLYFTADFPFLLHRHITTHFWALRVTD